MNITLNLPRKNSLARFALCALCLAVSLLALPLQAGPGAHGPDGEHLDAGASTAMPQGTALPRLEAHSELFELVASFDGSELSMLLDRFASNEPVLGASLEAEVDGVKASAHFHADHGDYAIDDPEFLQVLSRPGAHAVVFTIIAGDDADLLEGVLHSGDAALAGQRHAPDHDHDHDHDHEHEHPHNNNHSAEGSLLLALVGAALVALLAWLFGGRRRR